MNTKIQQYITGMSEDEVEATLFNVDAAFATALHNEDYEALDALEVLKKTKQYNIDQMEGNLWTTYAMGDCNQNFILETCSHEDCDENVRETIHECRETDCCNNPNCEHYSNITCLHHIPNNTPKEETMNTTTSPKTFKLVCKNCGQGHDTPEEMRACYGLPVTMHKKDTPFFSAFKLNDGQWMGSFWFATKTEAEECRAFYGVKSFRPANNGHGYKVYVHPAIVTEKGDFKGLIAAHKAAKKS
jgi:hypothetical protein